MRTVMDLSDEEYKYAKAIACIIVVTAGILALHYFMMGKTEPMIFNVTTSVILFVANMVCFYVNISTSKQNRKCAQINLVCAEANMAERKRLNDLAKEVDP